MGDEIKGLNVRVGGDCSELKSAFESMNDDIKKTQTNLNSVNKLLKLDPTNTELTATKHKLLEEAISQTSGKLRELKAMQSEVQKQYDAGKVPVENYLEFQKELKNTESKMSYLKQQSEKLHDAEKDVGSAADDAGKDIKEMGDKSLTASDVFKAGFFSQLAVNGLKKIGNACKEAASYVIEVGESYSSSMSQVAATMGMTSDEINSGSVDYQNLSSAAKEAGATTKFSATEAADALNYLALAGYDVNKSVETLPKVLDLAAAGNMDLATASDMVTDTMSALKLETGSLDEYVDMLAKTSQKSNTNITQLGEAILQCGGTVDSTGQDIDVMCTELGILANSGIKGAEGGTHLRNVLLSLTAPTDTAKQAMADMGLAVTDTSGNVRDINDIFADLNGILADMSEGDKTDVLNTLFNKTDLSAVNAMLSGTSGAFDELRTQVNNADGACQDMADTMQNNLEGKVTIFKSSMEGLGLSIFEKFDKPMQDAVSGATERIGELSESISGGELSEEFDDLAESTGKFIDKAIDFGESALPVIIDGATWIMDNSHIIVGFVSGLVAKQATLKLAKPIVEGISGAYNLLKTSLSSAESAQKGLNAAQAASPWGLVASGISLVVGGMAALNSSIDVTEGLTAELTDEQQELIDSVNNTTDAIYDNINKRSESAEKTAAEYDGYQKLVDKLYDLNEQEHLSNSEKTEMVSIVSQLNDAIPELSLEIDQQTGKVKNQREEIEKTIESQKEMAIVQGSQETLVEIAKDLAEAEREVAKAQPAYEEEKKKLEKLEKQYEDNEKALYKYNHMVECISREEQEYYEGIRAEQGALQKSIDNQNAVVSETREAFLNASSAVRKLNDEYDMTNSYIEEHTKALEGDKTASDEALAAVMEYSEQTNEYTGEIFHATDETMAKINELNDQYAEAVAKREEELESNLDRFSKFNAGTKISAEEMISNLESNLDGVSAWANGIKELAENNVNKGLLQTLQDAGPSSASKVQALLEMTGPELDKYQELWEKTDNAIHDIAVDQTSQTGDDINAEIEKIIDESNDTFNQATDYWKKTMEEDYGEIGRAICEGLSRGIEANIQTPLDSLSWAHSQMNNSTTGFFEINSPSKLYSKYGAYLMQGLGAGIEDNADNVLDAMEEVNKSMYDISSFDYANATARALYDGSYTNRITVSSASDTPPSQKNENYSESGRRYPENITIVFQADTDVLAKKTYPIMDLLMGQASDVVERGGAG